MPTNELPPFHSLPFAAYYRTECQDKYSTSRLAHHVAYFDNECASSLLLTPCLEEETETEINSRNSNHNKIKPSYHCSTFVHGHQYSRKVRCFGPWIDAAGFANATLSEISRTMDSRRTSSSSSSSSSKSTTCPHNSNNSRDSKHAPKA